jgi:hypothetical protein
MCVIAGPAQGETKAKSPEVALEAQFSRRFPLARLGRPQRESNPRYRRERPMS